MKNKVCIITGGTEGIGFELVKFLCKDNNISTCSRTHKDLGDYSVHYKIVDVSNAKEAKQFVKEVVARHGKIDVLVNNAGVYKRSTIEDMDTKDWYEIINVNLNGTFNFCKYVIPHMKRQNYGRIVNITSYVVDYLPEERGAYCCSKTGVNVLTTILSKEIADYNIKVNCFSPLKTATRMDLDGSAKRQPADVVPFIANLCDLPTNGPNGRYLVEGEDRT